MPIKNFSQYLREEKGEVYFTFGRMNPPTIGHGKVMDNLAKRRTIDVVAAFLEQDSYLANHLHFAWRSPLELTRYQLSKSMRTKERFIREIQPINGEKAALEYFTKRLYAKGSYNNLFV